MAQLKSRATVTHPDRQIDRMCNPLSHKSGDNHVNTTRTPHLRSNKTDNSPIQTFQTDRTQPGSPSQWIMTGSSVNDGKQPRGRLDLSDRRDEIVTTSRQSKGQ